MGVDVNLYATGAVTDEDAKRVNALLLNRCERFVDDWRGTGVVFGPDNGRYGEVRWDVSTMSRYYGPYYERGYWPDIAAAIELLRRALPECTIHYGGDSDDECPVVTDDYLSGMWDHWAGPHGDDYHREVQARNSFNAVAT